MAKKIILGVFGLLVLIVIISLVASPKSKESVKTGLETGKNAAEEQTQENKSPQQVFEEIGNKVSVKSSVLAQQEADGEWVVINTLQGGTELGLSGAKSLARDFVFGVYASGFPIKQAGITITSGTGKYYRAYVGKNQAKLEPSDLWSKPRTEVGPTIFYDWLKTVQTGKNDQDLANSTYLETNLE